MKLMNKMKHLLLSTTLVATLATPAMAADTHTALKDLTHSYAQTEINALVEAGILNGYGDGNFRPAQQMTRQEFAKVLVLSMGLEPDATAAAQFTDVADWARPYVGALVKAGITNGMSDTKFGATHPVTREQLAVFFVRALGDEEASLDLGLYGSFEDGATVADYAKPHVALMQKIGFIKGGKGKTENGFVFTPQGNAERQAVARLAYEFFQNHEAYQTKVANIEEMKALLDQSNAATGAATSMEMDMSMTVKNAEQLSNGLTNFHAAYTEDPRKMYITTSVAMDAETPIDMEIYATAGDESVYVLAEGQWIKMAMPVEFNELFAQTEQTEIANSNLIAPFLTKTEDEQTITLTGLIPSGEFAEQSAVDANVNALVSAGGNLQYTAVLDKETLLLQNVSIEIVGGAADGQTMEIAYTNYNSVEPIELPAEAQNAVDMGDMNL
ncbi:MAG TPA: S-layer homology domain-containing protein [Bacilli bacterium]|nr:S-layer homology domain-containing protein [Bacilli bacterium]